MDSSKYRYWHDQWIFHMQDCKPCQGADYAWFHGPANGEINTERCCDQGKHIWKEIEAA